MGGGKKKGWQSTPVIKNAPPEPAKRIRNHVWGANASKKNCRDTQKEKKREPPNLKAMAMKGGYAKTRQPKELLTTSTAH